MMIKIIFRIMGLLLFTLAACEEYRIVLPSISKDVQGDAPVSNASGSGDIQGTPSPLEPLKNEEDMVRGEAFIDESDLLLLESYPLQVVVTLTGTLPTPCHHLRATLSPPDEQNQIRLEVFSLAEPDVICVQMLQAFDSRINLGSFPDGAYTVLVNGEVAGEFTQ